MLRNTILHIKAGIIVFCVMLTSCDVFPTRTPEPPLNSNTNYSPASSYSVVLENFTKSVNYADYNNYSKCFASRTNGNVSEFEFLPSGSISGIYPSVFVAWGLNAESRNFKSIISALKPETKPVVVISNTKIDNYSIDSVVVSGEYSLSIELKERVGVSFYSGTIYLNMYRENDGLWYINKWIDIDTKNDSIAQSWSLLKANFAN